MYEQKRCIIHIPNYIDISRKSASNIRPLKMIEAFKENGYIVDIVMGYAKEKKEQINNIKNNINNGIKYDFLYSESSTMPTLLTEKSHLPLHPLLDFSFMKYCQKNKIKIGLFYRDIHWKFDFYKKEVPMLKRIFAIMCYKYDLYKYRQLLDVLYIPSEQFKEYLPNKNKKNTRYKIELLPPGCDIKQIEENREEIKKNIFNIFYVGGISKGIYDFEKLFEAISKTKGVNLTVCCREKEWEKVKGKYEKFLNERIKIVSGSGEELEKYYKQADVCSLIFNKQEYMKMAMPVKTFEYLSNNKPIIATKGTAAGDFIEKNNIGWTVEYETDKIIKIIEYLKNNKNELKKIRINQKKLIAYNTWKARASKVISDL